jgi:hypothetical protein
VLRPLIVHPVVRRLLEHPQHDRFDAPDFVRALHEAGLTTISSVDLWKSFAWFVASKPAAA